MELSVCQQQFLEGSQANKPSQCPLHDSQKRGWGGGVEGGKIIKMRGQEDFKLLRADEWGQVGGGGWKDNERLWERLRGGSKQRLGDRGRWGQTEGNLRDLACTRESRQARSSARRHEESKITPPPLSLSLYPRLSRPPSLRCQRAKFSTTVLHNTATRGRADRARGVHLQKREEIREKGGGGTQRGADGRGLTRKIHILTCQLSIMSHVSDAALRFN